MASLGGHDSSESLNVGGTEAAPELFIPVPQSRRPIFGRENGVSFKTLAFLAHERLAVSSEHLTFTLDRSGTSFHGL